MTVSHCGSHTGFFSHHCTFVADHSFISVVTPRSSKYSQPSRSSKSTSEQKDNESIINDYQIKIRALQSALSTFKDSKNRGFYTDKQNDAIEKLISQAERLIEYHPGIERVERFVVVLNWADDILNNRKISEKKFALVNKELQYYNCITDTKLGRVLTGIFIITLGSAILGLGIYLAIYAAALSSIYFVTSEIIAYSASVDLGGIAIIGFGYLLSADELFSSDERRNLGLEIKNIRKFFPVSPLDGRTNPSVQEPVDSLRLE